MMSNDFQDELARLFGEDDDQFAQDEALFVNAVERRINRHMLRRRVLLSGAVLIGGAIAGLQAPELLSDFSAYVGFEGLATATAIQELNDMPINIFAGIAIAALSLITTFSTERI